MAEIGDQYFSGNQASIFIGDVWVDEVTAIDYTVQHSRTPQYGYGSQHYDFIPSGVILVTGSFQINFKEPNYLWIILERYRSFNETNLAREENRKNEREAETARTFTGDTRKKLEEFFNGTNAEAQKKSLIKQSQALLNQSREFDGRSEAIGKENMNHNTFSIVAGYGYELGPNSPGETIQDVQIMGKSKIINADGRPISEQYNFIARKIV